MTRTPQFAISFFGLLARSHTSIAVVAAISARARMPLTSPCFIFVWQIDRPRPFVRGELRPDHVLNALMFHLRRQRSWLLPRLAPPGTGRSAGAPIIYNQQELAALANVESAARAYALSEQIADLAEALDAGSDPMVDHPNDRYPLQCEGCGRRFEGEEHSDAWDRAKAEGWEVREVSGRSALLCPWCASPGND